jgi:DNA-binding NarL/FixJ family response regulator
MPIRVVMGEDDFLIREGVKELLSAETDVEVVATCSDLDTLVAAVESEKPDVVLTDIRMPPTKTDEGVRAAERFRETVPDAAVLVLSQYDEPEYALALLEGGARGRGYLLKQRVADLDQLVGAIREVARGGSVIDPKVVEGLVAARARAAGSPLDRLTDRERQVLGEMAQGKNNAAIAASLVLTERAIERHINAIFSKLALSAEKDVHRRVKAVLMFLSETGSERPS